MCTSHDVCSAGQFCYEGICDDCSECHSCSDGIDGTCGQCGNGFPTEDPSVNCNGKKNIFTFGHRKIRCWFAFPIFFLCDSSFYFLNWKNFTILL